MGDIRSSMENAVGYLTEHPDEARYTDSEAVATLEEGLRFSVRGPAGASAATDMPESIGGGASAPSPAWFFRAGLASCVGSLAVMEAARDGRTFETLEVTVDSESDDRGILGIDESVPPGPLSVRVRVTATLGGSGDGAAVGGIMSRAVARCPVSEMVGREVPLSLEIEG